MEDIGERIKLLRKKEGLNQIDFCKKINLSQGRLSEIEKGKNKPSYETLESIKMVFNISLDWLVAGEQFSNISPEPNSEEAEVLKFYSSCTDEQKNDILQIIKSFMNDDFYKSKKHHGPLSHEEAKILELFRDLTTRDKIKIEGVIESKLFEIKDSKRGESSTCPSSEEEAAKKHA